ncbi:MAG: restriction endonuclease [Desulfomonile tiedjei]|nr:restriction endonuclease [Desulfomonile tiedjei]
MIDFTEIDARQGIRFEQFVQALLRALGWTIDTGAGVGPDGGRDIIATQNESTATGRSRSLRFVVQGKHYAAGGRAVSPTEIDHFDLMPARHNCDGWLLVTSTHLTRNAVDLIEAARINDPRHDFDYWDSGHLRQFLMREECHGVFAEYLPASYARFAHILSPSPAEIRSLASEWLAARNDRGDSFSFDNDSDNSLLGLVLKHGQTLHDLRSLLADEPLSEEFMAVWQSILRRGTDRAPGVVLLNGLRRLQQLRQKGLPERARHCLVSAEISMMSEHRHYKRRYWGEFVVYNGTAPEWTAVQATTGNAYMPPLQLCGALFAFFCAEPGQAASGLVRRGTVSSIPFMGSFSIESTIPLEGAFMPPLDFEVMTDPGSDPVVIACFGFSEFPGQWNMLA